MSATRSNEEKTQEIDIKQMRALPVVEAAEFAFSLPATKGVVILGPPGIGKTENVIRHALLEAKKLGKEPIVTNEARAKMTMDEYTELIKDVIKNPKKYYVVTVVPFGATMPDDLLGVPNLISVKDNDKVLAVFEESALKGSLALLTIGDIHGALIIDDALNAHDNVRRSFLLAVFQERLVGGFNGVKLSPNVRVVATGNLASESELASPLVRPMVGRAFMLYTKPEDLKSWYNRMQTVHGDEWFKDVYAFLSRYEKYYNLPSLIEEEIPTGPVPRSWSLLAEGLYAIRDKVNEMLKDEDGRAKLIAIVSSAVGVEAATQFVAFISKPVISVEEVLEDPSKLDAISNDMDLVMRFGVQLASKMELAAKDGDKEKVKQYLGVLVDLMERTTNDIGVFVCEMLSKDVRRVVKSVVVSGITSKDPKVKEVALKLRSMLASLAVSDALVGKG